MKIQSLGHVVIKVRNQARAEAFYHGILGLPVAARSKRSPMTFFTLGNHHDFAVLAVGDDAAEGPDRAPGLLHVAFRIGDKVEELRAARDHLEANRVPYRLIDHGVTQSIYFQDPDGNGLELYVDTSDAWKEKPELVTYSGPLELA